jgi:hypothetical protein
MRFAAFTPSSKLPPHELRPPPTLKDFKAPIRSRQKGILQLDHRHRYRHSHRHRPKPAASHSITQRHHSQAILPGPHPPRPRPGGRGPPRQPRLPLLPFSPRHPRHQPILRMKGLPYLTKATDSCNRANRRKPSSVTSAPLSCSPRTRMRTTTSELHLHASTVRRRPSPPMNAP